jgi:hypothetical protein
MKATTPLLLIAACPKDNPEVVMMPTVVPSLALADGTTGV